MKSNFKKKRHQKNKNERYSTLVQRTLHRYFGIKKQEIPFLSTFCGAQSQIRVD